MELTPASDTWVDTARLEAKIIQTEGNYAATMDNLARNEGVDPQTGMGPVVWNAWETTWTGQSAVEFDGAQSTTSSSSTWGQGGWINGEPDNNPAAWITETSTTTTQEILRQTTRTDHQQRSGLRTIVRSEERRVGKECRSRWSPYH